MWLRWLRHRRDTDARLQRLETTLYQQIPLSQAIQIRGLSYGADGLTLAAPLAPNSNHAATAFAGSLNALLTLAGWGLLWLLLDEVNIPAQVVIQDSHIQYLLPVDTDLVARCSLPAESDTTRFLTALRRRSMARIALNATIDAAASPHVTFHGRYVATQSRAASFSH